MKPLSKAEQKVFNYLLEGFKQKDIAFHLGVELITVKKHVSNILRKYNCETTLEAVILEYKNKNEKLKDKLRCVDLQDKDKNHGNY